MSTASAPARHTLVLALVLSAAFALGACGSAPQQPDPTTIELTVIAAPDANADPAGNGLPVVVRIYELKNTGRFDGADFYSLYDNEATTLESDLIAREQLDMRPGQAREIVRKADTGTQYLGVLAAFREIDQSQWKLVLPLKQNKNNIISLHVWADSLSVSAQ